MAVVATVAAVDVPGVLAERGRAIVAADTSAEHLRVIDGKYG